MSAKSSKSHKGFLSQSLDGHWVLTPTPDVPSCCIGHKEDHLTLEGDFSDTPLGTALTLSGTLEGSILHNPTLLSQQGSFPLLSSLLLGGALLIILIYRKLMHI